MGKQIIILPGIMGSKLRKKKQTVWPVFTLIRDDHYEHLKYDDFSDEVVAYEYLKLYYGSIEESLKRNLSKDTIVTPFYYDWRKSNLEHLERLKGFIDPSAEEVIFVAHSMGGIIVKLFLSYFHDDEIISKVKKVITIGTPWKGAPYAYKAIKYGIGVPSDKFPFLLSRDKTKLLAPTFPSLYQLLPSQHYHNKCLMDGKNPYFIKDGQVENDYNNIVENYYLPSIKEHFGDEAYANIILNYLEHSQHELSIDHFEIIGYGIKTICSIKENALNEPEGLFDNGDGTVPLLSAVSNSSNKYYIKEKHQSLPKNKHVIDLVNQIVSGSISIASDSEIKTNYDDVKEASFSGKVIKIACPVLVSLTDQDGAVIFGNIELLDEDDFNSVQNDGFDVETLGNTVYVFIPDETSTEINSKEVVIPSKILVEAYDNGATTISLEKYEDGKITKISSFKTFNINPSTEVELIIPDEVQESEILIKEEGKEELIAKSETIDILSVELIKPFTRITIDSSRLKETSREDHLIVSGRTELSISNLSVGSYPISGTYFSVNDEEYNLITKNDVLELNLREGRNKVVWFSRDIAGNSEEQQTVFLYNLFNEFPEVHFEFYHHQYILNVSDNNEELYREFNLERPQIVIEFKNNDGVIGENIFYREIEREITIKLHNVFNEVKSMYFNVDEITLLSIFEGTFEEQSIYEFLSKINIVEPYDYIKLNKFEGKGAFRTLTKEHIQGSKHINIIKDNVTIDLYKDIELLVSFQDFTQDIKLDVQNDYAFGFKVIDLKTKDEIRSKDFVAIVTGNFNDEEFISKDIEVVFNNSRDYYEGKFDLKELKEFLNHFWKPESLHNVYLIIQSAGNVRKVVETELITLR
ncbi:hypothetical protein H6F38_24390 [Paenibacillus sp. EKM208P]|nr:hypothetical protein H6F38_24390 [Paenibacillus sp. EKM208P]